VTLTAHNFEERYFSLRRKEQRLYTDEQVMMLPEIDAAHPHHSEWEIRKSSCHKLIRYFRNKHRRLNILEVGCGNGWLCFQLSKIINSRVTGIDINTAELTQGKKVFRNIGNLDFFYGGIDEENIRNRKFDIIVFAASIQYFPSLGDILGQALDLLNPIGELHILDSHFYKLSELEAARNRSENHFQSIGFPDMKDYYFHRCIDELKEYNYKMLYNPESIGHLFMKNKNPFPWICIKSMG